MKQDIEQPLPFEPRQIRFYPQRPFPAYRHIPGITPHPFHDPAGHSYGIREEEDIQVLPPDLWRKNYTYLYGVDLYNFSYWWEAAEMWESLWRKTEGNYRIFLQGLIQISVSLLKCHMQKLHGVQKLSKSGREKLRQVMNHPDVSKRIYMGIDLPSFLLCLDTFFSPFFHPMLSCQTRSIQKVKPLIHLHF